MNILVEFNIFALWHFLTDEHPDWWKYIGTIYSLYALNL